jgi:enoyl-CoA hydratase/carnithine racemase
MYRRKDRSSGNFCKTPGYLLAMVSHNPQKNLSINSGVCNMIDATSAYETIMYEIIGHVAVLTLNRPHQLNAMNRSMLQELNAACDRVEADKQIHALVLCGAGKAFCSGFDLKQQAAATPRGVAEWQPVLRDDFATVMRFWHLSVPTIAAIRGHALAGGFELALACDLSIAAEDAVFGEPELKFGAGIVVMLLPWLVGPKLAKEIILTGIDDMPAERARQLGLVNRVVPVGTERDEAIAMAQRLAVIDPMLVKQTKTAINRSYQIMGMLEALETALDIDTHIEGQGSPDKTRFLEILREQGLRGALAWRDQRFK